MKNFITLLICKRLNGEGAPLNTVIGDNLAERATQRRDFHGSQEIVMGVS